MKGANLKYIMESHGSVGTLNLITEALEEGKLKHEDFSLKELALAFCGEQWYENLNPNSDRSGFMLLEAGEAVDSTSFSNITGQIIYSKMKAEYAKAGLIASDLAATVKSKLSGEKIPGIGDIIGDGEVIHEGMPYPEAGFNEDYIQTPATEKRGMIVSVTREAIYFDRINQVLNKASKVGERLAVNKEKRVCDLILGVTNNYNRQGTSANTYLTSGDWVNKIADNEMVDWTSINDALALFQQMVDPYNGDPILINPDTLIVMPNKVSTARRIVNATEVREATNSGNTTTVSVNPMAGSYKILSSPFLRQRAVAASIANPDDLWIIGNPKQAFNYIENWGIEVSQAPTNNSKQFSNDIQMQFKASERGVAAVVEPKAVTLNLKA